MKCFMFLFLIGTFSLWAEPMAVQTRVSHHAAMPLVLRADEQLHDIARIIQRDLSVTQQFAITLAASSGQQIAMSIGLKLEGPAYTWQLVDGHQQQVMASGTVAQKRDIYASAHEVSDQIWHALTGQPGFFSTKIAYCKEVKGPKGRTLKHIYVADANGQNERLLVDTPTVHIGLRWHQDVRRPLLFYSEFTDANVRLMYVDMHKRRHIACDFDGVNMLPAFSQDGSKVVFSSSKGKGASQLYCLTDGKLKQITNNKGNNFSPTLTADGNKLYFCSDYKQRGPALFCFDLTSKKLERVPDSWPSESPCYSQKSDILAFCKKVRGTMQLHIYTPGGKPEQLTFDPAVKQGVSWSPCGQYLVYTQKKAAISQLCLMHVPSKRSFHLAHSKDAMSCPAWSPTFAQYVTV